MLVLVVLMTVLVVVSSLPVPKNSESRISNLRSMLVSRNAAQLTCDARGGDAPDDADGRSGGRH